eukprot:gene14747-14916_t
MPVVQEPHTVLGNGSSSNSGDAGTLQGEAADELDEDAGNGLLSVEDLAAVAAQAAAEAEAAVHGTLAAAAGNSEKLTRTAGAPAAAQAGAGGRRRRLTPLKQPADVSAAAGPDEGGGGGQMAEVDDTPAPSSTGQLQAVKGRRSSLEVAAAAAKLAAGASTNNTAANAGKRAGKGRQRAASPAVDAAEQGGARGQGPVQGFAAAGAPKGPTARAGKAGRGRRSEKTLAAMAAGAWLVKEQWVVDSGHVRLLTGGAAAMLQQPLHPTVAGVQQLQVVFYGKSKSPSFDTLARVLKAGGGILLSRSPPYTSVLPVSLDGTTAAGSAPGSGSARKAGGNRAGAGRPGAAAAAAAAGAAEGGGVANLAVVGDGKSSASDRWISAFLAAGVVCVPPAYLVDWLAHPWQDLKHHQLFSCKPHADSEVPLLEEARKLDGQPQEPSISF